MDFVFLSDDDLCLIDDVSVIQQLWFIEEVGKFNGLSDGVPVNKVSGDLFEDIIYRLEKMCLSSLVIELRRFLNDGNFGSAMDYIGEINVKCYHSIQDKCY